MVLYGHHTLRNLWRTEAKIMAKLRMVWRTWHEREVSKLVVFPPLFASFPQELFQISKTEAPSLSSPPPTAPNHHRRFSHFLARARLCICAHNVSWGCHHLCLFGLRKDWGGKVLCTPPWGLYPHSHTQHCLSGNIPACMLCWDATFYHAGHFYHQTLVVMVMLSIFLEDALVKALRVLFA